MRRTVVRRVAVLVGTGLLGVDVARRTTLRLLRYELGGVEQLLWPPPEEPRTPAEVSHHG